MESTAFGSDSHVCYVFLARVMGIGILWGWLNYFVFMEDTKGIEGGGSARICF